jgi:hypothetical protein
VCVCVCGLCVCVYVGVCNYVGRKESKKNKEYGR